MAYKLPITKVSGLQINPSDTNSNTAFYPPQLTEGQRDAIPTGSLRAGAIIYNTTDSRLETFLDSETWTDIQIGGVAEGEVVCTSSGNEGSVETTEGLIYLNTATPATFTYKTFRGYNGASFTSFYSSISTATGAGLAANNYPLTLPSGAAGTVEVVANAVIGFSYYNNTATTTQPTGLRTFVDAAWQNIYHSPATVQGVGLSANNQPFVLPSGVQATVEVPTNQSVGFTYYNSDATNYPKGLRAYVDYNAGANQAWQGIYSVRSAATGIGLTNGQPFTVPLGAVADVEVAGNESEGFIYYNSTNNLLRGYLNGDWRTISVV